MQIFPKSVKFTFEGVNLTDKKYNKQIQDTCNIYWLLISHYAKYDSTFFIPAFSDVHLQTQPKNDSTYFTFTLHGFFTSF